jgi:carboxypeptidase Taq
VHWSSGSFGYFPTYTLGNCYAAQLYARASELFGDLDETFSAGDFAPLLHWLREQIHRQGARYDAPLLIERVTGSPPDAGFVLRHLEARYLD